MCQDSDVCEVTYCIVYIGTIQCIVGIPTVCTVHTLIRHRDTVYDHNYKH